MKLGQYRVWLRTPRNYKDAGKEAIELASTILLVSDSDVGNITAPVRAGWEQNFASESEGDGNPWARLAKRTEDERETLGYGRSHPILVRSGSYKDSWTKRGAPGYFEKTHKRATFTGDNVVGQANQVVINLGSTDYRVAALSGGTGVPSHLAELEERIHQASFADLGLDFAPQYDAGGAIPPRPVTKISQAFSDLIGFAVGTFLMSKVRSVKGRQ